MKNNNEKGVALIAAVMITAILAGIGISFAFNMRLEEQAAANYLWKTQADAIAQGGIERTIRTIIAYRNEQRTFIGTAGVHNPSQYGFAPLDVPLGDGLTARSEIVVRDEAGKVNINASGHGVMGGGAFANHHPTTGHPGISRGWTTAEIELPSIIPVATWRTKFGSYPNPQPGIATGAGTVADDNRLGGTNPFGANEILAFDRIDNDGDGFVDEAGEGVNEPSEFVFIEGGRVTLDLPGDDRPFITLGETEVTGAGLSLRTTLYSRDRFTDQDVQWGPGGPGSPKVNINAPIDTPAQRIAFRNSLRDVLIASGLTRDDARQVAVNVIDFRDADSIPTRFPAEIVGGITFRERRGIERTLFLNEAAVYNWRNPWEWWDRWAMRRIELHNPWNTPVIGEYRIQWRDASGMWHIFAAPGDSGIFTWDATAPFLAQSFWHREITNSPAPASRAEEFQLEVRIDGAWHIVERMPITQLNPGDDSANFSKDDPRVPEVFTRYPANSSWGPPGNSLLGVNAPPGGAGQMFRPARAGEVPLPAQWAGHFNHFNRDFHNTGELGYIHTGRQWSTLRMRDVRDAAGNIMVVDGVTLSHQGAVLNRVTIGHPYNRHGRININTAEPIVLMTLPQMGIRGDQAQAIFDNRPFNTIGDAVPHLVVNPEAGEPTLNVHITELMRWIQDIINWAIHWPSTWGWPLGGIGRDLHNEMINRLRAALGGPPTNLTISYDTTPPFTFTVTFGGTTTTHTSNNPIHVNFFQRDITTTIVRTIANHVVNVTNSVITLARTNVPDWFGWRESLIGTYLTPIVRAGNAVHTWSLGGGDDVDSDGFNAEDDERETIARSVSNLITTRSDRFEIISTGSVLRGGETLAMSEMRVIVCRISTPVTILHFERR